MIAGIAPYPLPRLADVRRYNETVHTIEFRLPGQFSKQLRIRFDPTLPDRSLLMEIGNPSRLATGRGSTTDH
jgi:hypothetical protein